MGCVEAEMRSDQWGLVWAYTLDGWVKVLDVNLRQAHRSEIAFSIPEFNTEDDPSSDMDPRLEGRMERMEQAVEVISENVNKILKVLEAR